MSILGDILREMTDSWNEQSKRNVTVNVPTLDQPTRVGNYPPLSPEREAEWQKTAPRMSRAEAAAYAPADARAGPYGFISQAILSRPEGMPSHVARDVGFVNYLTEYKRIERESKMMRDMMRDRAVGGQLKRISEAKEMIARGRLNRMLQSGMPMHEAAAQAGGAFSDVMDLNKALQQPGAAITPSVQQKTLLESIKANDIEMDAMLESESIARKLTQDTPERNRFKAMDQQNIMLRRSLPGFTGTVVPRTPALAEPGISIRDRLSSVFGRPASRASVTTGAGLPQAEERPVVEHIGPAGQSEAVAPAPAPSAASMEERYFNWKPSE